MFAEPAASGRGREASAFQLARAEGVAAVSLIKSSGYSLLDDRARTAVRRWIFRPARRAGRPVATQVDVPVRFSLNR